MVSLRRRLPARLRGQKPAAQPVASSTPAEEAHVPRWLRPSVRAARVATLANPAPSERREPILFAAPIDGVTERLVVRYDLVQLLDRANEALGIPLCELDTGDEIEVIELNAIWAHVRTPAGREGWLPAMTLAVGNPLAPEPHAEAVAGEIDGAIGDADLPALEELLAMAAERRALRGAPPPATEQPPKPPKPARQGKAQKSRKTNRPTSARKKKRR